MRILVVEDDELISNALEKILSHQKYIVDLANNGQIGWELVEAFTYDLVILDIVLPRLDGIQFCHQLRKSGNQIPVLLLTAQDSSNDKVMGLDAGADDYVVKPFDSDELLARIRVLLRRSNVSNPVILNWGNLRFNPSFFEVTYENKILSLTPKEYRLLELFLRNRHRVFSRGDILEHLWSSEQAPSEESVTVHIKDLRKKLTQVGGSSDFIETVYGQGYRLKQLEDFQSESSCHIQSSQTNEQIKTELSVIWEKYKGLNQSRLELIEKAAEALRDNNLKEMQCKNACQVAHKLAGALGIFGFSEGSYLAKEIEIILKNHKILGPIEIFSLYETLRSLKITLNVSKDNTLPQSLLSPLDFPMIQRDNHKSYPIVLISDDIELVENCVSLANSKGLSVKTLIDFSKVFTQKNLDNLNLNADIIVLNLSLCALEEKDLACLARIVNQTPPIPVMCMATQNDITHRVKMNCLAAHIWIQKPLLPEKIIDAVIKMRSQIESTTAKIMVVDDDEVILTGIRALLEPLGLNIATLNNPSQLLATLEKFSPDLLVLDLKMPYFNGIELCQILRNTPQWSQLHILFLTAHADMYTTSQILHAGANGCIIKHIGQTSIVTRILNCLERTRLHRSFATCIDQIDQINRKMVSDGI